MSGLREEHAEGLVRQRKERQFDSLDDFKRRVPLSKDELRTLAELGALNCFAEHRRAAMWEVEETLHDDLLHANSGNVRSSRAGERVPRSRASLLPHRPSIYIVNIKIRFGATPKPTRGTRVLAQN